MGSRALVRARAGLAWLSAWSSAHVEDPRSWKGLLRSYRERVRRLQDKIERLKAARVAGKEWPEDPVEFCVRFLGFTPTVYQKKLLRDPAQLIAARWSRQSGKTHCVAALLLWSCLRTHGFNVIVLAPSIRQSKIT